MTDRADAASPVVERSWAIAKELAGPAADEVDGLARFPSETIAALADARVLAAVIPERLGGEGCSLSDASQTVFALARECSSSGMVLAMHHSQVACLVRHGATPEIESLLQRIANEKLLVASATTEAGIGGKMRESGCAVVLDEQGFALEKQAAVLSYGAYADVILATARRTPESPSSDQSLVACVAPDFTLEQVSEWDTLGLRGTCSPGFILRAHGPAGYVLPDSFADIASTTMVPFSHVLWSHVWLGLASAAVDRATAFTQKQARKTPGELPPSALRLAELTVVFQQFNLLVSGMLATFDEESGGHRAESVQDAIELNSLKVGGSLLLLDVVTKALSICGMDGYRQGTPFSMGRLLRDAHGAALMINNDRILSSNAQMQLVAKRGT